MASRIYVCACVLLISARAAFAQSADTPTPGSNAGLPTASSIASPAVQPNGLRTNTQPLSAGPPAAAPYVGPNWQSINNQTPGHVVDGWTFYPMVTGATYFDDNVFATPTNRQSDWAFLLRPELAVTKGGQDYGIEAHAYVEGRKYVQFDSEDQVNGGASLGGTVMLNQDTQFQGRAQYVHGHEDRGGAQPSAGSLVGVGRRRRDRDPLHQSDHHGRATGPELPRRLYRCRAHA